MGHSSDIMNCYHHLHYLYCSWFSCGITDGEFTHLSSCRDFTLMVMMMMMMMMIVMKTAIINNINKSFLLQLPSDESWNASGTRLSQTWAFLDVRFSTMSSNFTIHFELSLALKLPSWSILETSYSLVQLLSL